MRLLGAIRRALGLPDPVEENRQWAAEINRSFILIRDPEALRSTLASRVRDLLPVSSLVLFERELEQRVLSVSYAHGAPADADTFQGARLAASGRLVRWLEANDRCIILADTVGLERFLSDEERVLIERARADLCVPIVIAGHLNGLMLIGLGDGAGVSQEVVSRLEFLAGQAGLALESSHLLRLQLARTRRLQRAERLAAVGKLAAGTAHEIRNPLTSIRSTMQYFQRSLDPDDERVEAIARLLEEVDRIDRILEGLLRLTRSAEVRPEEVEIDELVGDCLELQETQARRQGVEIDYSRPAAPVVVQCDRDQIRQVVMNLVTNAVQAMPEGGLLRARVSKRPPESDAPGRGWALLEVIDGGPGIAEHEIDRCFDPLYTSKSNGTGLGLPISLSIVEHHGGELKLSSRLGEGTRAMVRLPLP